MKFFCRDLGVDNKHLKIRDCDYMQTGPALVAEISPTRRRAGPVNRAGNAVFFSCNRLRRAGQRAGFVNS